jgi:L-asparaginase type I
MKPKVYVLTTGGTIAFRSKATGPAVMDFRPADLVSEADFPDVELEFREVVQKGSMDIVPGDWKNIAVAAADVLMNKPRGIVILHGTDTMHYTAAALSFMLENLSVPIVMTGSMIPGGDANSDSYPNLRDAVSVAAFSEVAEVCIVFSNDPDRKQGVIIRGCRAKKLHSHAINAFASINVPSIGYVEAGKITYTELKTRKRKKDRLTLYSDLNSNVVLIKLNPTVTPKILSRFLQGASGAVLEGTGIGHLHTNLFESVASYGKPVVMCTQAAYGGEKLGMYDVDKTILGIENIIPGRDMTSEAALVKLMWALRQKGDLKSIMHRNIAGEISD